MSERLTCPNCQHDVELDERAMIRLYGRNREAFLRAESVEKGPPRRFGFRAEEVEGDGGRRIERWHKTAAR